MSVQVIGAGWGRTATNSLRLSLEQLGFGDCHHMFFVGDNQERLLPLWNEALDGRPNWDAILQGNPAAVDWPVAGYWRELIELYPEAKVVLTTRSSESWYESFSQTILKVVSEPEEAPEDKQPLLRMARRAVVRSTGIDFSRDALIARFKAHEAAVKANVPADKLLVFSPQEGWPPLCEFLGKPIPEIPFPRSNYRDNFFARIEDNA